MLPELITCPEPIRIRPPPPILINPEPILPSQTLQDTPIAIPITEQSQSDIFPTPPLSESPEPQLSKLKENQIIEPPAKRRRVSERIKALELVKRQKFAEKNKQLVLYVPPKPKNLDDGTIGNFYCPFTYEAIEDKVPECPCQKHYLTKETLFSHISSAHLSHIRSGDLKFGVVKSTAFEYFWNQSYYNARMNCTKTSFAEEFIRSINTKLDEKTRFLTMGEFVPNFFQKLCDLYPEIQRSRTCIDLGSGFNSLIAHYSYVYKKKSYGFEISKRRTDAGIEIFNIFKNLYTYEDKFDANLVNIFNKDFSTEDSISMIKNIFKQSNNKVFVICNNLEMTSMIVESFLTDILLFQIMARNSILITTKKLSCSKKELKDRFIRCDSVPYSSITSNQVFSWTSTTPQGCYFVYRYETLVRRSPRF